MLKDVYVLDRFEDFSPLEHDIYNTNLLRFVLHNLNLIQYVEFYIALGYHNQKYGIDAQFHSSHSMGWRA